MRIVNEQKVLNDYGDFLIPTTGVHGGDISSQRTDDLDRACLDFLQLRRSASAKPPVALDLGGGLGSQSKRMAQAGADVYMIDLSDQSANIADFNSSIGRMGIRFFQADVRTVDPSMLPRLDIVYSQRMLSCIRHLDARRLLGWICDACTPEARCFISAAGLYSEIGRSSGSHAGPIEQRWLMPSQEMAAKHQIHAPECPYSEQELTGLLESCAFEIVRRWTSPFGNPKVICTKR